MNNASMVTGIRDVSQGHGLDIKPYGLFTSEASPGRGSSATNLDASAGLDLFYNPTPILRINLTINTDFAQTEVDQRQVNLTRFSLFFLSSARFFWTARSSSTSRAATDRTLQFRQRSHPSVPQPPHRAERGPCPSEDRLRHEDHGTDGWPGCGDSPCAHRGGGEDLLSEDFTVARVKRRLLSQSYVGAMYTRRNPLDGNDARHTRASTRVSRRPVFWGPKTWSRACGCCTRPVTEHPAAAQRTAAR